jgi:hypothetical protein
MRRPLPDTGGGRTVSSARHDEHFCTVSALPIAMGRD